MKEKTLNHVKSVAHITLVILSMLLSINLFIQFSDKVFIQVLFGAMAFSLEAIKLYILLESKFHFRLGGWKNDVVAAVQFSVFLGLAFISIVASLGFTLVSIEEQSLRFTEREQLQSYQIDALQQEIDSNNRQIEIIQVNASELEFSAVERNAEANAQVLAIQERNRQLVSQILSLQEDQRNSTSTVEQQLTSSDMFRLLGETVNLSGRDTMFYMMLVLVILLEIAIAITSGSIEKSLLKEGALTPNKPRMNSITILEYIDALFSEDGKKLVPDSRISKKLNISLHDCEMYRETLKEVTYKGKPMITARRGGTVANFSYGNMKKIVQFHLDSGKLS